MSTRIRCDCCGRRRSIMKLIPIPVSRDIHPSGGLVVCEDRAGCANLDMPVREAKR